MKYSIIDFQKEFPNDDVCLDYIASHKLPVGDKFYRVAERKAYANAKGKQVYPLKGTIFEKSDTSLVKWFYAIYLFSASKNGVSAKELQRQLTVTYKTAWRIAYQVRKLMEQGEDKLSGIIEADETYIGGKTTRAKGSFKNKTPVIGLVERGGAVKAKVSARETHLILNHMKENIKKGSAIMSDQFGVYEKAPRFGFTHSSVNHWRKEFARGEVHTNTIEGFWSQLKRSLNGTYHAVSVKHLQHYVDEFAFRYSHRASPMFDAILAKI